jgi:multicomponent K+:H+ antiporter subunit G
VSALTLPLWAEWLVAALLMVGAAFVLIGSWALVKFSDFFKRLHGPSKASTLGVGCVLLAAALVSFWQGQASGREALVLLFLFVTAPVSAHLLVKAALRLRPEEGPKSPADQSGRPRTQ